MARSSAYKSLELGKQKIEYARLGRGEPLVFLHGFSSPPEYQMSFLEGLAGKYDVIAPRLFGVNYLKNQPKTIEDYVDVTGEFISKLGLGRYHLAGHSTGGAVAFRIATKSQDTIDVIGIDPVLPSPSAKRLLMGVTKDLESRITKQFSAMKDPVAYDEIKKVSRMLSFMARNTLKSPRRSRDLIADIARFNYDRINVNVPALILYGTKDTLFDFGKAEMMSIAGSFAELYVKKAEERSHLWLMERPSEVAEEVLCFMDAKERLKKISEWEYLVCKRQLELWG